MTLQISKEQFAALRRLGEEKFIVRASDFLREQFPAIAGGADPAKLAAAVRQAMARAAAYGFETERDIVSFLTAMMQLGPRFDEDPNLTTVQVPLRGMPGTPAPVRMAFLMNAVGDIVAERKRHGG
jgi:hypothetical protein